MDAIVLIETGLGIYQAFQTTIDALRNADDAKLRAAIADLDARIAKRQADADAAAPTP